MKKNISKKKWDIESIKQELMRIGDGTTKLLSKEYKDNKTPLTLQCSCGRIFERCWNAIKDQRRKNPHKCNFCNNQVRWNIELINEKLKRLGNTICLSKEYKNNKIPLLFKCGCGREFKRKWNVLLLGENAYKCDICNNKRKWDINLINEELKKMNIGVKCLSNKYINNNKPLLFQCKCGRKFERSWVSFISNESYYCGFCQGKVYWTPELIKEFIISNSDCEPIGDLNGVNTTSKIMLKCACGEIFVTTFDQFKNAHKRQCNKCGYGKYSGKNHYLYNPNKTDEERIKNRYELYGNSMQSIREKVFKRDNYTCQCCGSYGGDLNAHHLNGWNWDIENRFNLDNLITLCEFCHENFHKQYGYGNNTKKQFEEYIKMFKEKVIIKN